MKRWLIYQLVAAKIGNSDVTSCVDILANAEDLDENLVFLKAYCNYVLKNYDACLSIFESLSETNVNFSILKAQYVSYLLLTVGIQKREF